MGRARVNIVDISNFKRRVNDFASGVKELNSSVNYEISSIDTNIKKDINKLEESIAKCQKSMEHAKNKLQELEKEQEKLEKEREELEKEREKLEKEREDLEKELNDLKRELENIPKTIVVLEPIGTDDKGNTIYREVEKPNPEFINLTDKLLDFNNDYSEICDNISEICDSISEICNDISTIKIKTDELNKLKNDLENIISCINNSKKIYQRTMSDLNNCSKKIDEYCRNISNKSDMADSQLQKAITAIQKYKDEKIHINPVPSHKSINWTTPLTFIGNNEISNLNDKKSESYNHDNYKLDENLNDSNQYKDYYDFVNDIDLSSEYRKKLFEVYKNAPLYMKQLFADYARYLQCNDSHYKNKNVEHDAYFSYKEKGFKFDQEYDIKNNLGSCNTFFHESAHMIDYLKGNGGGRSYSEENDFSGAVRRDFYNALKKFEEEALNMYCSYEEKEGWSRDKVAEIHKQDIEENAICKFYNMLNEEKNKVDMATISDVFQGISEIDGVKGPHGNGIWGSAGHPKGYWNDINVSKEAYADITATIMTGEQNSVNQINTWLPETMSLYNKQFNKK